METLKFKLLSGVECEIRELLGKEQRILTSQNGDLSEDKLSEMLASITIRVGSVTQVTADFIKKMGSGDRKKMLGVARQYSLRDTEHEKTFKFNWDYTDSKNNKASHPLEVDLSEGFPEKPYKFVDEAGNYQILDITEYDQFPRNVRIILPRSKKVVQFDYLTGEGEGIASKTKEKDRSSHTQILMRNPKEITKTDSGAELPIVLDLDKLALIDIEEIRKVAKELDGDVDTTIQFEHPEADKVATKDKTITLNLVGQKAFFYPSEAI